MHVYVYEFMNVHVYVQAIILYFYLLKGSEAKKPQ